MKKIEIRAEGLGKTESAGFNAMAEMWEATPGDHSLVEFDAFAERVDNLNNALAALANGSKVPCSAIAAFVEKWSVAVPAHGKESQ
jgi:hypothetical protein